MDEERITEKQAAFIKTLLERCDLNRLPRDFYNSVTNLKAKYISTPQLLSKREAKMLIQYLLYLDYVMRTQYYVQSDGTIGIYIPNRL